MGVQDPRERLSVREAEAHYWVKYTKKEGKNKETQSPEMDSRGQLIGESQTKNIWLRTAPQKHNELLQVSKKKKII